MGISIGEITRAGWIKRGLQTGLTLIRLAGTEWVSGDDESGDRHTQTGAVDSA